MIVPEGSKANQCYWCCVVGSIVRIKGLKEEAKKRKSEKPKREERTIKKRREKKERRTKRKEEKSNPLHFILFSCLVRIKINERRKKKKRKAIAFGFFGLIQSFDVVCPPL